MIPLSLFVLVLIQKNYSLQGIYLVESNLFQRVGCTQELSWLF